MIVFSNSKFKIQNSKFDKKESNSILLSFFLWELWENYLYSLSNNWVIRV